MTIIIIIMVTNHNITSPFLSVYENYTDALSEDTKHLTLDGQLCFYILLFLMFSYPEDAFHGLEGTA